MKHGVNYRFEDFTETEYHQLLLLVKKSWMVIPFSDYRKTGNVCLWRHDVDFSMHRAYRLAQIEAEEGVRATYFIHLHSNFYNALEDEIAKLILGISELRHDIGLHFDPQFYSSSLHGRLDVKSQIQYEQGLLEHIFGVPVRAFSYHLPDLGGWIDADQDMVGDMVNAYGRYIKDNYSYCSDSNGYWRYRRLRDILEKATDEKLHILTHPEMWTPEPMSPRERVTRCIEGRAARQHQWYDDALAAFGRENVH